MKNGSQMVVPVLCLLVLYVVVSSCLFVCDLIEQRGKTALININQIQVSICVIIPNKLCVSASEAHLPVFAYFTIIH
jgi:hypothetical protein